MYITILGRQPALGAAELERLYGSAKVQWFSDISVRVDTSKFDFEQLGGSQKAGRIVSELRGNWHQVSQQIVSAYTTAWQHHAGKITLGISTYGFSISGRDVQKTGIILKQRLKSHGVSLRLIPNTEPALNTAASHHNKLGLSDNHVELLIVRASNGTVIVAESVGAQNITALAARDQARPRTDAFVGMLPPKLARMMINLAAGETPPSPDQTVLDPFCGTGVVLQEAALLGYTPYGSDLSEKMVAYSTENLAWLKEKYRLSVSARIEQGDAMTHRWRSAPQLVVAETYLGQPFSAPPSPAKLQEVRRNCDYIVREFLTNIHRQVAANTYFCLAVPAWRDNAGRVTYLPVTTNFAGLGFEEVTLKRVSRDQLLYYREDQVVARKLLILKSVKNS